MPATSSASSGDSVQRAASNAARMTSAICSTGIVRQRRAAAASRSQQQRRTPAPSRNEPKMTYARVGASSASDSVRAVGRAPARGQTLEREHRQHAVDGAHHQQPLGHLAARPRLVQHRQRDHRRGRHRDRAGEPQRRPAARRAAPARRHADAGEQRPRARRLSGEPAGCRSASAAGCGVPSSNTSTAIARSISGFQGSRSVRSSSAQRERAGQRADQHDSRSSARQPQAAVQHARPRTTASSITSASPAPGRRRAAPSSDHSTVPNRVGDLLGHGRHPGVRLGVADRRAPASCTRRASAASQTSLPAARLGSCP